MKNLATVVLGLFLALPGATLSAQTQLAPIDEPFSITVAAGLHGSPLVTARPDGSYLVVWTTEQESGLTLSGRLFGPGGAPLGPQFAIATGDEIASVSIALLPDGGFVAVWDEGLQILGSLHDRDGRVRIPEFQIGSGFNADPKVAASSTGEWLAVWEEQVSGGDLNIGGRWFGPDGTPLTSAVTLSSNLPAYQQSFPGVTALPGGGFLVAWTELNLASPSSDSPIVIRRFPAPGVPAGTEEGVMEGGVPHFLPLPSGQGFVLESRPSESPSFLHLDAVGRPAGPEVRIFAGQNLSITGTPVLDASGRLLLVGRNSSSRVVGRIYDPTLIEPVGAVFEIPTAMPATSRPVLASAHPGQFLMVWANGGQLFGEILVQDCTAPGEGLCLADGRFRVEVTQQNGGSSERAHAVPLRDDTGSFWFFSPSNAELLIKILDGRSLNGHFWVFYGSLSDVPYEIRVTDTTTGESRVYTNPAGTLASRADIEAFPLGATPAPAAAAPSASTPWKLVAPPLEASVDCQSSDAALCLSSTYQVRIDFVDPVTGDSKQAHALPFSFESGAFWFFDPANLELFVKVLDGSAINGHIWIFHGALSDVDYTLTVRGPDGAEWSYHNRRGDMHSGADTSALPAPGGSR